MLLPGLPQYQDPGKPWTQKGGQLSALQAGRTEPGGGVSID